MREEIDELAARAPKDCRICDGRICALELVPNKEQGGIEYWATCVNDHRVRLD